MRSKDAHKQLARTSLSLIVRMILERGDGKFFIEVAMKLYLKLKNSTLSTAL